MLPPCPLCEAPQAAFSFAKNGFSIFRCPRCDFRFVHPPPGDAGDLYGEDYFRGARRGFGYVDYDLDKVAMESFFASALDRLERFRPERGALLDVGAATGFFLKLAARRGWRGEGLEISPYAVRQAAQSGSTVRLGILTDRLFPESSFHAVTLFDVIEHVSDPAGMLAEVKRLLIPGGLVVINTPDTASWWARLFGRRWHAFCPPEHLSYLNRRNLSLLLSRHGFRVEHTAKIGKRFTPAYVFSMLRRWQGWTLWRSLEGRVRAGALNRIALPINIRDNFFLIARRID